MPGACHWEIVAEGPDACVVSLHGELDIASAPDLKSELGSLTAPIVTVDLADLKFMDSAGITALVGARNATVARGGSFRLQGAEGSVRRVIEITGLSFLLTDEA
jgi:anti-sigma B factor antagonist